MTRVLLVDDDEDFLTLAKKLLGHEDPSIDLVTSTSALDALQLLEREDFEAIVSDYQMPEMNGLELLEYLRAKGSDVPFIVFTGRGREDVAIQALNLGADRYLKKGDELKSLFAELAHYIKRVIQEKSTGTSRPGGGTLRASTLSIPDIATIVDSLARVIAGIESQMTAIRQEISDELREVSNNLRQEFAEPIYSIEKKINEISKGLGRLYADVRSWKMDTGQEITAALKESSPDISQAFLDRLDTMEKEIDEISNHTRAIAGLRGNNANASGTPRATKGPEVPSKSKIPGNLLIETIRRSRDLKKAMNELMAFLQWKDKYSTDATSKEDILKQLNVAKGTAQSIAGEESVSAGLKSSAQEFTKVIGEIEDAISSSEQDEFIAPDMQALLKPKERHLEQLIGQLD